jgi:hypothetical protein
MFLRSQCRKKNGKEHTYWSVVESQRLHDGRVVQRQVLYLGEVNDSQRAAWRKPLDAHAPDSDTLRQIALFPHDRPAPTDDDRVVRIRLDALSLRHPRQWGGCWLALELWDGQPFDLAGEGNGPLAALVHAFSQAGVPRFEIAHYHEHALSAGEQASAIAYIQVRHADGRTRWGAAVDTNIELASVKAVLSALNRL